MEIDGLHLTFCTNIHTGESWNDHFKAVQEEFDFIKKQVSTHSAMGIGLRLSNLASLDLNEETKLDEFKQWLHQNNAYVFTMNGFPYGGFHHTIVKDKVHAPDWTTRERVEYTIRLFHILSSLLPQSTEGSISTSPLSYRHWHKSPESLSAVRQLATINIIEVVNELIHIRRKTGKIMHLDIEPEPDGLLETGDEFIHWFENDLMPACIPALTKSFSIAVSEAERLMKEHVCLCYDICHFAIGYEEHETIIDTLISKGIKVGKVQISAALKAEMTDNAETYTRIKNAFVPFNESTYLHQVVAKSDNGLIRYPDLPAALADEKHPHVSEWRAHFHVPVFIENLGILETTQKDIVEVLSKNKRTPFSKHFEVETYTWEVLPTNLRLGLGASIARELTWVKAQLA